jgi:DNA-binding CsgD family transcriptional regulator
METLQSDDLLKLHQGIQQLYTLQDRATFKVEALRLVDRLVPSDILEFHSTNMRTRKVSSLFLPDFPGYNLEMQEVIDRHFGEHPIVQNMPQALAGAHKISDFISQQKFYSYNGVYQQFFRLLGIEDQLTFFFPNANTGSWRSLSLANTTLVGFSLNRSQRNFTERDRLVLNLLRPHLSQAHENIDRIDRLQQQFSEVQQSLNCLGSIVLNWEGHIKSIAPQAIIWLENYFTKPNCIRQLPDLLRSWVKYQIGCLTQNTDRSKACLPLKIQQAGRELTIRLLIELDRSQYLLLLEERALFSFNSLTILGLSQRETEVLGLVMQGKDNKAIATQLGIHPGTIRKHLEHVYAKWGVTSRTEAIAHALTNLGFF